MPTNYSRYGRHAKKRTNWIAIWAQVLLVIFGGITLFMIIYHGDEIANIAQAGPESHRTSTRQWVHALKSGDAQKRREAVDALDKLGSNAPEVVAALKVAAQDEDPVVRISAEAALRRLSGQVEEPVTRMDPGQHSRVSFVPAQNVQ